MMLSEIYWFKKNCRPNKSMCEFCHAEDEAFRIYFSFASYYNKHLEKLREKVIKKTDKCKASVNKNMFCC